LKQWPKGGPELLWSIKGLGGGFASVTIAEGIVYTTGVVGKEKLGTLMAADIKGNILWQKTYGPGWSGSHPGTRTTPTVDDGNVYVISGYGNLVCFDAKTGQKKWNVDVLKRFEAKNINWGISESVLIVDDKVICTPGANDASIVALNKLNGQTIWATKGLSDPGAYCSPILIENGSKKIAVTITDKQIVAVDIVDGSVLWQYTNKPHKNKPRHVNPNTPIYIDNTIFMASRFVGITKLKVSDDWSKVSEVWTNPQLDPHHGGLVLVDGCIHGTDSRNREWMCLDYKSSQLKYSAKLVGKGSLIYADERLYCYGEDGQLALVKITPTGYEITGSVEIKQGKGSHWAHPAISDGVLYIRHGDALMAYDIKNKEQ
jgi:outer membrane protein assembly factor BamB